MVGVSNDDAAAGERDRYQSRLCIRVGLLDCGVKTENILTGGQVNDLADLRKRSGHRRAQKTVSRRHVPEGVEVEGIFA